MDSQTALAPTDDAPLAALDVLPAPHLSPVRVYLASLTSEGSRRTMLACLRRMARRGGVSDPERLPWHHLTPGHLGALRAAVAARCAPATTNLHMAALRGVVRAAWQAGLLDADERDRRLEAAADVPGSRLPPGRALEPGEVARLLEAAPQDTPRGARDAALVALLVGAGLRISEPGKIALEGYDGRAVRVVGKGNKERRVPLPPGARAAVDAWLRWRGSAPGPLVCQVRRGRTVCPGRALGPKAATAALLGLARRAGVALSSHDLRRTLITSLLSAGHDAVLVARLVGHASPVTTARYDRRPDLAAERAMGGIDVPFEEK